MRNVVTFSARGLQMAPNIIAHTAVNAARMAWRSIVPNVERLDRKRPKLTPNDNGIARMNGTWHRNLTRPSNA